MYPAEFFSLFPPFPRRDEVFVAMSFAPEFTNRWQKVIKPAVNRVNRNGNKLNAVRVDTSVVSDSILTEILAAISQSRLVFADISTIGLLDGEPIRNGNVMYEVGLAQAVRLPEEILLFRSDNDPILFDLANVRVNKYDPDNSSEEAPEIVSIAISSALDEIDMKKHFATKRAAESLETLGWDLLWKARSRGALRNPEWRIVGGVVPAIGQERAIGKLLEIGALRTSFYRTATDNLEEIVESNQFRDFAHYEITEFGMALIDFAKNEIFTVNPELYQYANEKSEDSSRN